LPDVDGFGVFVLGASDLPFEASALHVWHGFLFPLIK
jgi:hypothetical protein